MYCGVLQESPLSGSFANRFVWGPTGYRDELRKIDSSLWRQKDFIVSRDSGAQKIGIHLIDEYFKNIYMVGQRSINQR